MMVWLRWNKNELFWASGVYHFKPTHRRLTMKTKNGLIITATVLSISLAGASAWAGSKQQHRWEGVAIGVGAAIAVSALIHHHDPYHQPPVPVRYAHGYRGHYRHGIRHHGYGYPRYRGHYRHFKFHHRGHGHYRWHYDRGRHGYGHGYNKHGKHWKSHRAFDAPYHGKHNGRANHGRGHRRY
jgi:hypothetical protein